MSEVYSFEGISVELRRSFVHATSAHKDFSLATSLSKSKKGVLSFLGLFSIKVKYCEAWQLPPSVCFQSAPLVCNCHSRSTLSFPRSPVARLKLRKVLRTDSIGIQTAQCLVPNCLILDLPLQKAASCHTLGLLCKMLLQIKFFCQMHFRRFHFIPMPSCCASSLSWLTMILVQNHKSHKIEDIEISVPSINCLQYQ